MIEYRTASICFMPDGEGCGKCWKCRAMTSEAEVEQKQGVINMESQEVSRLEDERDELQAEVKIQDDVNEILVSDKLELQAELTRYKAIAEAGQDVIDGHSTTSKDGSIRFDSWQIHGLFTTMREDGDDEH